jgi:hypothetical protein
MKICSYLTIWKIFPMLHFNVSLNGDSCKDGCCEFGESEFFIMAENKRKL